MLGASFDKFFSSKPRSIRYACSIGLINNCLVLAQFYFPMLILKYFWYGFSFLITYIGVKVVLSSLLSMNTCNCLTSYDFYLVDPASSHTLVLKIKPCMSKCFDGLTLDCRRLITTVIVLLILFYRWIPVEILELIHDTNIYNIYI